jgi:hypothetical protein
MPVALAVGLLAFLGVLVLDDQWLKKLSGAVAQARRAQPSPGPG